MDSESAGKPMVSMTEQERVRYVMEVYERGRTIDALRRAEEIEPLPNWRGVEPCVLAARIAANVGAPRLSTRLSLRAWKTDCQHPDAQSQYAYELLSRRGPFVLWRTMRGWADNPQATPQQRAELLAVRTWVASELRDFSGAERLCAQAEALDPGRAWIRLQRVHIFEMQDRVEAALDAAREACALHPHPHYRVGVQTQARLLQLLDRDEEAIALLREADGHLQNGPLAAQLYSLLSENGCWTEAETALERYVALSPLLEPHLIKWTQSQRARVAYHLGRRGAAARLAESLEDEFHKQFAARLAVAPALPERVQLDVTFVRQHFKTCAPATLAALGRYWRMPAAHLQLAEAMCYDGTPSWQQRDWATRNGWHVREFRVTHEAAVALIEREIPFAISTVEATSAHMMAVIGFDRARGTLLLRDPGQPYVIETCADEFLKRYRAFGPEGAVFIPEAERARLDGLELPDALLHDEAHAVAFALAKHDRQEAEAAFRRLTGLDPEAALTWEARLQLASYDANNTEQLRCLDRLLELFPGNPARLLRRLGCLRDATREERIRWLESVCRNPAVDPALLVALARAFQGDARVRAEASRRLQRAIRFRPMDTSAMSALADLRWEEGRLEEATEIYRCAADIEGFREPLYQSWFIACHRTRRRDEAMAHLQDRFARFGSKSDQPALTLAWAWRELDQPVRAREVLTEAMRLRPEDGYLRLRAAGLMAGLGEAAEAEALLSGAKGRVRENDWLRTRAELAENRLDYETVLAVSRELLAREPLALDAHTAVARALARREGVAAAVAELKRAGAAFPHHYGLQRLIVEWSHDDGPQAVVAAARELLRREPADAWARRELALALGRLGQGEAGLLEAQEAARIEPRNSYCFSVLGHLHRTLGQLSEARAQFRHAVTLSVDNGDAIEALLQLARTDAERKDDLAHVERELIAQVVIGDGLLAYLDFARPILQPEVLLEQLRRAHRERPDLWHAWSALVLQLGHMGRLDEALTVARGAAERFKHLPRVWLDLASVHQWRKQAAEETAAAERAFELNPAWNRSALALAEAHERQGRLEAALQVYELALRHAPRDAQLHAAHAHLLWRLQRNGECFSALEQALRLAPGFDRAWGLLLDWAAHLGQPERAANFARALTRERPGDLAVWLVLARVLNRPADTEERLAAVDHALTLDRRSTEAWDLKAELLAAAERFEEAIQACRDGAEVCAAEVHLLRGRQAWIEAERKSLPEAVRLMRAVLADNASYVWGWHQLGSWLVQQGELAEATTAFEKLQHLRPHDAWVNRQLGFLRLKQKDAIGARKEFAAALAAAPTDVAAAHNLLDAQIEASDLEGAAVTLQTMQLHQPGAATMAAELKFRLHQGDTDTALACFDALIRSPEPDPWAVNAATDVLLRRTLVKPALQRLKQVIGTGAGNPQNGVAVLRLLASSRRFFAATHFFLSLKSGELQTRTAPPMLQLLAENRRVWLFRWLLWRRRDVLFRDDAAWGQVGFALSSFQWMKSAVPWLADWERRANVQPWMLFNYCLALRHVGRCDEATRVARHVISTWGHREGSADLRLFVAIEDALRGEVAAAQDHLERAVVRSNTAYDQQMVALIKALVKFHTLPPERRRKDFAAIRRELDSQFGGVHLSKAMLDVRQTFARAGKSFQRGGAGWRAWLWCKRKQLGLG